MLLPSISSGLTRLGRPVASSTSCLSASSTAICLPVARSVRYPHAEARTLYEWGLMYADRPDPRQARERLEEAAEIFRTLGSRPYSDLAQKAMAALS